MKQIAIREGISWHRIEFRQIKGILEKMTAVTSLIDSYLGYGRPQTAHTAAKITKLRPKDLALIFRSVSLTQ